MVDPEKIRTYLRDKPELNVLLGEKEQFEDEDIQIFDGEVREEIILEIPALKAKAAELPDLIIIQGIIALLLESVAHQELRNQMSISDDNVGQIDFSNKAERYLNLANMYRQKMLRLASRVAEASYYRDLWGEVDMPSADYEFYIGGSE